MIFFPFVNKEASVPKIIFHGVYSPDSNFWHNYLHQPLAHLLGSTRVVGSLGFKAFWVACMWKLKFEQEKDNYIASKQNSAIFLSFLSYVSTSH